ncbi:hypothetical protein ACFY4C_01705 [Actinomadura viridis]|uniref:hypothetical protein n=1 Tax=Actinomadura viridis TaxID=58110 RepID=UPI00367AC9FA
MSGPGASRGLPIAVRHTLRPCPLRRERRETGDSRPWPGRPLRGAAPAMAVSGSGRNVYLPLTLGGPAGRSDAADAMAGRDVR